MPAVRCQKYIMPSPISSMNTILLALKDRIIEKFNSGNWQDIALLTDSYRVINDHPRLLRSLDFGDDDYSENVGEVLLSIVKTDLNHLATIQDYVDRKFGDSSEYISAQPSERRITFAPSVFKVPDVPLRDDLVAIMMPFSGFDSVHTTIKNASTDAGLDSRRADDIWVNSTFIQDIVNLIFQAKIVVCDFSGRNANVFYETGIAHTLGKSVVPIAQSLSDIPSDLQHHRALPYLNNREGLLKLRTELATRLRTLRSQ